MWGPASKHALRARPCNPIQLSNEGLAVALKGCLGRFHQSGIVFTPLATESCKYVGSAYQLLDGPIRRERPKADTTGPEVAPAGFAKPRLQPFTAWLKPTTSFTSKVDPIWVMPKAVPCLLKGMRDDSKEMARLYLSLERVEPSDKIMALFPYMNGKLNASKAHGDPKSKVMIGLVLLGSSLTGSGKLPGNRSTSIAQGVSKVLLVPVPFGSMAFDGEVRCNLTRWRH